MPWGKQRLAVLATKAVFEGEDPSEPPHGVCDLFGQHLQDEAHRV
jgi:hypothetical protein